MQLLKITWILSVFLASCSSLPPICEPKAARKLGISQAMSGKVQNLSPAKACLESDQAPAFQLAYEEGYTEGKSRFCDPSKQTPLGQGHGSQGEIQQFDPEPFRFCKDQKSIYMAYLKGYQKGLNEYCAIDPMSQLGQRYGEMGREADFQTSQYSVCGENEAEKLNEAYQAAYQKGLTQFCKGDKISEEAFETGRNGGEAKFLKEKFRFCGEVSQQRLATLYKNRYEEGVAIFCDKTQIIQEARRRSELNRSTVLPTRYALCFHRFPDLATVYQDVFKATRKDFEITHCTFEQGRRNGISHATETNEKDVTLPAFCSSELFSVYVKGYLEGWNLKKEELCQFDQAHLIGQRAGRQGQLRSPNIPPLCSREFHSRYRQRYNQGFDYGVIQAAPPSGVASAGAWNCTEKVRASSGTLDTSRCKHHQGNIACYQDIEVVCKDSATSKSVTTQKFRRFTGACTQSYSDCWSE